MWQKCGPFRCKIRRWIRAKAADFFSLFKCKRDIFRAGFSSGQRPVMRCKIIKNCYCLKSRWSCESALRQGAYVAGSTPLCLGWRNELSFARGSASRDVGALWRNSGYRRLSPKRVVSAGCASGHGAAANVFHVRATCPTDALTHPRRLRSSASAPS